MKRKTGLYLLLTMAVLVSAVFPKAQAVSRQEENVSNTYYISEDEISQVFSNNTISTNDNINREMRGTWIATVKNTNMKEGMNETEFTAWAESTVKYLDSYGFNTVVFQVRPTSDALYKSDLNPWSSFITGQAQGTDPGYDPLQIMIDTSHKYGIELHAWINPYRVSMPSDNVSSFAENSVYKQHPQWLVYFSGQYYLNPGIPEVKDYLVQSVMEIVNNYDVDAIHIDDYFYPYPVSGQVYDDSAAYNQYGAGYDNIGDWRRDNVTQLIRELYSSIKESKYWVQLGISPFGVWRNASSDITGSDTRAGHECYDSLYADTRTWIQEGIIDYVTPQLYWTTEFSVANYNTLLNWWSAEIQTYAQNKPVNLYLGMADYKLGTDSNSDPKWKDLTEIHTQISNNRESLSAKGQMHYSVNYVLANTQGYLDIIQSSLYNAKVLTPSITWLNGEVPAPVSYAASAGSEAGIVLNIKTNDLNTRKYVIYRFEGSSAGELTDENILGITYNSGDTVFIDTKAQGGKIYTYCIKSVSYTGVTSTETYNITVQN